MRITSIFRRVIAACLLLCALTSLFACKKKADVPMDGYSWSFVNAVYNGQFIHYSPDAGIDVSGKRYETATPLSLSCTVDGKKIVISDSTNNKTYEGRYSVKQSEAHGTEFLVTFNGVDGRAYTTSETTHGAAESGTLLTIAISNYIVTFRAD
jgi:hypothetical protein